MNIIDLIMVISFGVTCFIPVTPSAKIATIRRNSRPSLVKERLFLSSFLWVFKVF